MDGGEIEQEFQSTPSRDRCIELVDGSLFDPMAPDRDLMSLPVIAAALANNTRFAGQVKQFYSIAQHSVLVALLSPQDMPAQRCAVLHDADECFGLPDMATPIKPLFPDYVAAQKQIGVQVDLRYSITPEDHRRTKPADRQALLIEKYALKDSRNVSYWERWSTGVELPEGIKLVPLSPEKSLDLIEQAMAQVFEKRLPITADWLADRDGFELDIELMSRPVERDPMPAL